MKWVAILGAGALATIGLTYQYVLEHPNCTTIEPLSLPHISNETPGLMLDLPSAAGKYRYMDVSTGTTKQFGYAGKLHDWNAQNAREYCAYLGTFDDHSCVFYTEEGPRYALVTYDDNHITEVPRDEVEISLTLVQVDGTHLELFPVAGDDREHAVCSLARALRLLGAKGH